MSQSHKVAAELYAFYPEVLLNHIYLVLVPFVVRPREPQGLEQPSNQANINLLFRSVLQTRV